MKNKNIGIAIRLTRDPKTILDIHYGKELIKGKVAFSTSLKFDKREIADIEEILFFFKEDNKKTYVMANVLQMESKKEAFIPEKWEEWIPEEYLEAKNTWFLINGLRVVKEEELEKYVYAKNNNIKLIEVLKQARFPRTYFRRKIVDIPSLF